MNDETITQADWLAATEAVSAAAARVKARFGAEAWRVFSAPMRQAFVAREIICQLAAMTAAGTPCTQARAAAIAYKAAEIDPK